MRDGQTGSLHRQAGRQPLRVAIQPLAPVDKDAVETARRAIAARFRVAVDVLPTKPLPREAYYAPRDRYRADRLLDWLEANTDRRYAKVVAITARDISTTSRGVYDWGVFGLGGIDRRPCVLSTFRLGRGVSRERVRVRLGRVAVHEVGHTFGLDHCPRANCTMQDAGGSINTVDRETGFCPACVRALGDNLR